MSFAFYLSILSKVLPVIFLFILGIFFRKTNFISDKTVGDFKKIIINIALPSLLFISFSNTNFEAKHLVIVSSVFITCIVLLLIGKLITIFFKIKSPYFSTLLTGFEAGMLGYSIFGAVFGAENIFKFAIIDLGQVTFVFFILVAVLVKYRDGSKSFFDTLVNFIKTPVIIAILGGILVQKTGFTNVVPSNSLLTSVLETFKLLSTLVTPLICLVIGYEIKFAKGSLKKPVQIILLRMVLLLSFALIINKYILSGLLHLDPIFQAALMTMFILPPPFIIPLYISDMDVENKSYVFNTLSLNTIVTLVLYLVVSTFYLS